MGKISFDELVNSEATPLPNSDLLTPARDISFAEIVCAAGSESVLESEFVEHFVTKQMLHIMQDDRTRFEYLLSWQTINDLLSLNLLEEAALRVARDGRDIPPSLYRTKEGDIELVDFKEASRPREAERQRRDQFRSVPFPTRPAPLAPDGTSAWGES